MTKCTSIHHLAGTAIAAFLALSSTSALAQDASVPAEAPAATAPAPPSPAIVLPPVTTTRPATRPVIEEAPEIAPAAVKTRAPATRAAPARTAPRAVVVPAPAVPEAAAPTAELAPAEAQTVIPTEAGTADQPQVDPVAVAAPVQGDDSSSLLYAGLAGALGLGAIGLFAATRRRRVEPLDRSVEYEPAATAVEPAIAPSQPTPLVRPAFAPMAPWSEPRVTAAARPGDTNALTLNRAALLDRMVAAEPDSNNPFTSSKARRRRARLMLQSIESERWDDAELSPGFDWRKMAQAVEERDTVQA